MTPEHLTLLMRWAEAYLARMVVDHGYVPDAEERQAIIDVWKDAGKELPPWIA